MLHFSYNKIVEKLYLFHFSTLLIKDIFETNLWPADHLLFVIFFIAHLRLLIFYIN